MNQKSHRRFKVKIRGEVRYAVWPPGTDEDWKVLFDFIKRQDETIHKLRRAVVSLEKKVHWGLPTTPVLKKWCVYRCFDEEGNPVDPASVDDEGDGTGAPGQEEDDEWDMNGENGDGENGPS